jgi:hypothetical protein
MNVSISGHASGRLSCSTRERLGIDQTTMPRAPARSLLRLASAEDRVGLPIGDDEAALACPELEQARSGPR